MKLTVEKFVKLRDIVYGKTGLFFETKKIYFAKKRLAKRMEALSLEEVDDYINLLTFKDKMGREMQEFLNLMTTNETYFFREENQLKAFSDFCLPEVMARKKQMRSKSLRIWSAGCSSGEEPYTLGILLKEKIPDFHNWNIEILGTDIDTVILEKAAKGFYQERSVRFVPPLSLSKYFTPKDDGFAVAPLLKSMVRFRHLNLFESTRMRTMRGIDFIFCRNVLIYFDDGSRKSVMANFYDSLNPGGYVYLGHSESITRITGAYDIKRAGGLILHQKPLPPGIG